jgi:hypothetical protein
MSERKSRAGDKLPVGMNRDEFDGPIANQIGEGATKDGGIAVRSHGGDIVMGGFAEGGILGISGGGARKKRSKSKRSKSKRRRSKCRK